MSVWRFPGRSPQHGKVNGMSLLLAQLSQETPGFLSNTFWAGVVGATAFGLIGIFLLLLGYWLFDLITPKIDVQKELCEKNLAVAIVVAALLLGIAYVAAHVVQG
jgi:putative membrane protein